MLIVINEISIMVRCHAMKCRSSSENKIRFFRFPRDEIRRFLWLKNCGKNRLRESSKLCEFHFDEEQYEQKRADGWRKLKPNAVPTIFFHTTHDASSEIGHSSTITSNLSEDDPSSEIHSSSSQVNRSSEVNLNIDVSPVANDSASSVNHLGIGDTNQFDEVDSVPLNADALLKVLEENRRLKSVLHHERIRTECIIEKNKCLQKEITAQKMKCTNLRHKFKRTHKKYKTLLTKITKIPVIKYFAENLDNPKRRWSPESLKFATQIRYAVGWKSYIYLKKKLGIPLPSYSTICRNTNQLDFKPGILYDMITLMKAKKNSHKSPLEADCVALIDEMDIQPSLDYDLSTGSFIGYETCHQKQVMSSCVVVVMLRGLNTNWKQIIAWHLTTKSSDDDIITKLILDLIDKIEEVGYRVHGLVSDMGPKNKAVWRNLGIKISRTNDEPFIQHPIRKNYNFYIFPDCPHLLKNLRMSLINNKIFKLSRSIVESNKLPCNEIRFCYVEQLYDIQTRYQDLRFAPQITREVLNPTGFNKMNVAAAAHIFSLKTAAAIETLVKLRRIEQDALTTVWFLREVNKWFNTMNGRHPNEAIGKANFSKCMKIVDNFLMIIENIIIGDAWKPVQTGIKMSCINIMNLTHILFKEGYDYFLTTRVNQDALENLFSVLRRYSSHPTAIQTKRCLRLISVSQFTDSNTCKNYNDDEDDHYIDFFVTLKATKKSKTVVITVPADKCMNSLIYDDEQNYEDVKPVENIVQCNMINYVLGCAISFVLRKKYVCSTCAAALTSESNGQFSIFTEVLSIGFLENPSNIFLKYILVVEAHLQEHLDRCVKHPQLNNHLIEMIRVYAPPEKHGISRCSSIETGGSCSFVEEILHRYIYIRQIIFVKEISKKRKENQHKSFGSKSAQRQSII